MAAKLITESARPVIEDRLNEEYGRVAKMEQTQRCFLHAWVTVDWGIHLLILFGTAFTALTNSGLWNGVSGTAVTIVAIVAALLTVANKLLHSEKEANVARRKHAGYGRVRADIQNLRTVGVKAPETTEDTVYNKLDQFNKDIAAIDGIADG